MALLEAAGLAYEAGGKRILDGVGIGVERGDLVGVIGPNGAGKTTLLRLLCGLIAPAAGSVSVDGRPVSAMRPAERARRIAFMSQDTSQAFAFTVTEVLLMARYPWLARFERETGADRERASRALAYVGLAGFESRSFTELSGGERQLVMFARVLVQDTEVIALDEPSASLDIRHQDRVFSMARELSRERRAVVASVHDLDAASRWCTRLVLLDRGRLAATGTPGEVLQSAHLDPVYGVRTMVSANPAAGGLSVAVIPERLPGRGPRVHLVGGAGSAVNLTRELLRLGCEVTGGITHEHDSDEKLWKSLGVEHLAVGAFSRIGDGDIERAADLVAAADLTVLCAFPVGTGNLGNLRLAARARRLVVMEPGPGDTPRSFFAEEGRGLFAEVAERADILTYEQLVARVKNAGSAPAETMTPSRTASPQTDGGARGRATRRPGRRKR
jgi:iron complex transport system ATP-binding protein